MDLEEFVEEGFLQEVNRLFFHPRGMALVMGSDEETGEHQLWGIWDARDDPEGIVFEEGAISLGKALKVEEDRKARYDSRVQGVGFWAQPLPEDSE